MISADRSILARAALEHWRAGRLQEAGAVCDEMLRRMPRDPAALILAARVAAASGDASRAILHARRAMAAAPEAPEPLFFACAMLLRRGDPAANPLLPRLDRHPGFAPGWIELGQALLVAGQPKAALVAFDRAVAIDRQSIDGHLGRAEASLALRDPGQAAAALAVALALAPVRADIAHRLGAVRRQAGDLDGARDALLRAVALDKGAADSWFALGLVEQDRHDARAAVAAYRAALGVRPDFHAAALNLGVACQDAGDLSGALAAYAIALRLEPQSFGRIVHALTCGPTGGLWLDLEALRRRLAG